LGGKPAFPTRWGEEYYSEESKKMITGLTMKKVDWGGVLSSGTDIRLPKIGKVGTAKEESFGEKQRAMRRSLPGGKVQWPHKELDKPREPTVDCVLDVNLSEAAGWSFSPVRRDNICRRGPLVKDITRRPRGGRKCLEGSGPAHGRRTVYG